MIKVLDKSISDKIAAGEVIERPVSIIKELLENSIDSGADTIAVEIKNGGKTYMRVTDNGCGISAEEVETAFLRHATSKISEMEDLKRISSLGFRGEALASIAAVTRLSMVTRRADDETGRRIVIHGGSVIENKAVGCPAGTTVVATDIFYNLPARREFLKGDNAESGMIIKLVQEIAVAYPGIRIQMINNGNVLFSTTGSGNLKDTVIQVMNLSEYKDLKEIDGEFRGIRVRGLISSPSLTRTTRKEEVFFVNGRVVNSGILEKALSEGYRERLFEGRYPVAYLFIDTDPETLDVNIHPNKREVRFHDDKVVMAAVSTVVADSLVTERGVVEASEPSRHANRTDGGNLFRKESSKYDSVSGVESVDNSEQVDIKRILSDKRQDESFAVSEGASSGTEYEAKQGEEERRSFNLKIEDAAMKPFDFNDLKVTGSIFDTYITCVSGDDFYLVDQHAAHERIFYEELIAEYERETKTSQEILTPFTYDVPLEDIERSSDINGILRDMGYVVDDFGPNTFIVKGIPGFMDLSEAEDFLKDFVHGYEESGDIKNTVVIDKIITRSCKSAVKANDRLSESEQNALISRLSECRNPFSCPHGRPTFIRFRRYDIEKMFKRV